MPQFSSPCSRLNGPYLISKLMDLFQGKLHGYSAGSVLDFGTGAGGSVRSIMDAVKDFDSIIGVDTTEPQQEIAQDLLNDPHFDYILYQGLPLPFESGKFDTVCMSSVLHHLPADSRQPVLVELKRVLKPGGYFLFVDGYRNDQTGPRKTQILVHDLRAFMDLAGGIHHYPTLTRQELIAYVESLEFAHNDFFDFIPEREDFKDKGNLDNIARFIDQEIEKWTHLSRHPQFARLGERLKKRLFRTGYLGAKGLVAICC